MADVILHPARRAQLQAELAMAELHLKMAEGGMLHLLAEPGYRANTLANARRAGLSIQEMHARGAEGARRMFEEKIAALRLALGDD